VAHGRFPYFKVFRYAITLSSCERRSRTGTGHRGASQVDAIADDPCSRSGEPSLMTLLRRGQSRRETALPPSVRAEVTQRAPLDGCRVPRGDSSPLRGWRAGAPATPPASRRGLRAGRRRPDQREQHDRPKRMCECHWVFALRRPEYRRRRIHTANEYSFDRRGGIEASSCNDGQYFP